MLLSHCTHAAAKAIEPSNQVLMAKVQFKHVAELSIEGAQPCSKSVVEGQL